MSESVNDTGMSQAECESLDLEAKSWGYRDYQDYLSEATTVENNTAVESYFNKLIGE